MTTSTLTKPVYIEVRLSPTRVFKADLSKELAINTDSLAQELFTQASKYAWWATLADLAGRKVDLLRESGDGGYHVAVEQYELLCAVREALNHRKTALLELWENPQRTYVLEKYQSNLRALQVV